MLSCSFTSFEDFNEVGALEFSKAAIVLEISFSYFSLCTRKSKNGGAIFCQSNGGQSSIANTCFQWCNTLTEENVDFGQSAYIYVTSGTSDFLDNSLTFCSVDKKISRNGGYCPRHGQAVIRRSNVSNSLAQYSPAFLIWQTSSASVSDCTLVNLTTNGVIDVVCCRAASGASVIQRVIFATCANIKTGSPSYDTSYSVSFSGCVFANCTNFAEAYYPAEGNEFVDSTSIIANNIDRAECMRAHLISFASSCGQKAYNFGVLLCTLQDNNYLVGKKRDDESHQRKATNVKSQSL